MSEDRPRYELTEYIGKGGMGAVFRGVRHGADGFRCDVAIKQLRSSKARDDKARRKFLQEALISAALRHPNIVPVFDYARGKDGHLCLIMEFVDGVDLHELMQAELLPIPVVVYIIGSVLRGLAHAHQHGIIHRDITPGNVMISRAGAVQITDFGLAHDFKSLKTPSYGGTPGFMSPEALQEQPQDARSDLFSAGVILYELLTGKRPFPGAHHVERIANTLSHSPPPPIELRPAIPETLSDITMRLLARERGQRFNSAVEVLDALPQSRHESEDLAALVQAHVQARQPAPELSSEDELTTEQFRRKIGDSLWGEANDGNTVIIPEPVPVPISFEPEVAVKVSDSTVMPGQPAESTPAEARPAIVSFPGARPDEDAERAERAPSSSEPSRDARPRRRLYFALTAAAALIVCGVLGLRALRHGEPSEHITTPSTSPEQADEPGRGDVAQAPEGMHSEGMQAEVTPTEVTTDEAQKSGIVAKGRAGRAVRAQARKQPRENREASRRPVRWRRVPIGTDSPWDVPIHRGAEQ